MAKMLFKQGGFRILSDDVGKLSAAEANQLIKTAGTTCYQTRETSKKTPEQFILMFQKSGHYAMLEHSWRTIEMSFPYADVDDIVKEKVMAGFNLYKANNLFCITERPTSLLISGNSRMFNEAWVKNGNIFTTSLHTLLVKENPVLFPRGGFYEDSKLKLTLNPELSAKKEILIHRAMTVEFNNNSRGMTHETVRSRSGDEKITSYAQESTRYVDYAIKSQIVQTYNLNEWRHWLFIRTSPRAHPEIRFLAIGLLKKVKRRIPECFNDFEISDDGKSAVYKGNDPLV